MKKIIFIASLVTMFTINVNSQTKKDGTPDMRYSENKQSTQSATTPSTTTPSTPSNSNSRPIYNGDKHTTSHGGTYQSEQNSQTHKGGTYENTKTNNQYGTHKK